MLDIDALQSWIGREQECADQVSVTQAQRMAALLDHDGASFRPGDSVPAHWYPMLFGETAPQSRIGPDGHPRKGDFLPPGRPQDKKRPLGGQQAEGAAWGSFLPPVPLPRRMFAGRRVWLESDLTVGEMVHKHSRIHAITPKQGRSGQMCFVTVRHEIRDASDRLLVIEEQDIVYREQGARNTAPEEQAVDIPDGITVVPDETMLFRYSAITFNAHRIHYDRPYAQQEEGYPGLVVNGGLTLMLMWEYAVSQGFALRRSDSRSLAPLFACRPVRLAISRSDSLAVRAYDDHGRIAAEAVLSEEAE